MRCWLFSLPLLRAGEGWGEGGNASERWRREAPVGHTLSSNPSPACRRGAPRSRERCRVIGVDPLFRALIEREIKNRFLGGALSPIWWLAQPLLTLGVYALVFGLFMRSSVPVAYGDSFVAYLAVGLWPWLAFADAVTRSASSLIAQSALITRTALPRLYVPLSTVVVSFALNWLALTVIVVLFKLMGFQVSLSGIITSLPAWIALLLVAMGFAWIVSTAQVLVRDVEGMLTPLFMLLSFICGIQYGLESIPAQWRDVILANPFTHLIARMHDTYLASGGFVWIDAALVAAGALIALLGYAFFQRVAPHVDDYL
jgi:lipopolysaccharide transport system permease protein